MSDPGTGLSDRDKEVLDVTFNSAGESVNNAWGWKIPRNPARVMGEITEAENEVREMAHNNTRQTREVSRVKTYTYWAPFNYDNATVELGRPGTGVEFNMDGAELDIYPYGSITIEEEEPIVAVAVIGSGGSMGADPHYCVRIIRVDVKESL